MVDSTNISYIPKTSQSAKMNNIKIEISKEQTSQTTINKTMIITYPQYQETLHATYTLESSEIVTIDVKTHKGTKMNVQTHTII